MKKWIVAGLIIGVVIAVGVFILTTKNTNDTKSGDDSATRSEAQIISGGNSERSERFTNAETAKQTEMDSSVNFVPSSAAGGEKEWLAAYAEENLSAPVLALLGLDGKLHDYNSMLSAIAMLPKGNIAAADVAALRDMLTWPNDQFPEGMREIEINSIKNDVLDRLLRQKELPEALGYQLVDMFADTESDPVWRDYCVQLMSPLYERLTTEYTEYTEGQESNQSEESVDELNAVRETMFAALDEREGAISGTALIGVELLSRTHGEFDRDMILDKASKIAANEAVSNESRLTALRLTSVAGADESTADTARNLAQTGEAAYLRSAAIVTLGETGTPEDRELLESFTFDDDRQIAAAAELALQKMDARDL
ncbi:MAG: hypothetical protein JXR40_08885 [Pontiellaceae bacterium]|nr:hypothetical protein [Pontiellaceae bacterium]